MIKIPAFLLFITLSISHATPVNLDVSFISTLTKRKYFKYDAAGNQYSPVTRKVTVQNTPQTVDYEAVYVNNDKHWAGKYSSFGTGGITAGINYDFYTEESYYLFKISTVGMGSIADDALSANYALDLICSKYFGQTGYVTLELVQLPWTFSDLYDKREQFEYNPYDVFKEIAASPAVGEFVLTSDKMQTEPYDKLSTRLMLKGLKACETEIKDNYGTTRYEYGIYTIRVKNTIDFRKCGGVSDYKLVQGSNLLSASLTNAAGSEISGLSDGLTLNVCVNGYTTPGWGFMVEKIRVRDKSALGDQLAPPPENTVCPNPEYAFKVADVFKLFEQLNVTQSGTQGESVRIEARTCGNNITRLAFLTDGAMRNVRRSVSVLGYKVNWSNSLSKSLAVYDPWEPYPPYVSPAHTYTNAGLYNIQVAACILFQVVNTQGQLIGYDSSNYIIIEKLLRVRPKAQAKTRMEMASASRPIIPVRSRLLNESVSTGHTQSYDAYESIITGPVYSVESGATLNLRAPMVRLFEGTWFKSGARVCISGQGGATALAFKAREEHAGNLPPVPGDSTIWIETAAPDIFMLEPNQPNPFNPSTAIKFILPRLTGTEKAYYATLKIFNLRGGCVRTLVQGLMEAGVWQKTWDGRDETGQPVAAGVYLYQLVAGKFRSARKMTLLR